VEHRTEIKQLGIELEPAPLTGERAPEKDTPTMVEQQVILGVAHQLGRGAGDRAIRDPDPGNHIGHHVAPLSGKAPPLREFARPRLALISNWIAPSR